MKDHQNTPAASDKEDQKEQLSVENKDTKTKKTTPTLYPDVEFVNRTLP
jgi:hypothetical protein